MTMEPVLHSFSYCLDYLREQVADVSAADMVGQPSQIANHPAWVLGHLAYACEQLGGAIGLARWLPPDWAGRYGTGSMPVADAGAYETKDESLAILADTEGRIRRGVEQLSADRLDEPFPDASYRAVFPTIRHAITQVLVGHTANHIG